MFISSKFAVRHLPKTGVSWVRNVLNRHFKGESLGHQSHVITETPMFTFVRNPWAWHVSLYNFNRYGGKDKYIKEFETPERRIGAFTFLDFSAVSFEEFVRTFSATDRAEKEKIWRSCRSDILQKQPYTYMTLTNWKNNDLSFYDTAVKEFTQGCAIVGKTENIRTDTALMLKSVGCLTPQIESDLLNFENFNIGLIRKPYQEHYSDELRDLIDNTSSRMIEKYGYEFNE